MVDEQLLLTAHGVDDDEPLGTDEDARVVRRLRELVVREHHVRERRELHSMRRPGHFEEMFVGKEPPVGAGARERQRHEQAEHDDDAGKNPANHWRKPCTAPPFGQDGPCGKVVPAPRCETLPSSSPSNSTTRASKPGPSLQNKSSPIWSRPRAPR